MTACFCGKGLGVTKNLILFLLPLFFTAPLYANSVGYSTWLSEFQQEAISRGVRPVTVYDAMRNVYPDEGILEKDKSQPEKKITAEEYWDKVVNERRIQRGKAFMRANRETLRRAGEIYGVQPRFIVALLGVESDYGDLQGSTNVISALATLAYDGRRAQFFREELINALRIIDQGHIRAGEMVGSWAGAMGYCQFMPTSFLKFAQDFNGDGDMDIWSSIPDVIASTANYLRQSGWKSNESWGRAVRLKQPIPDDLVGLKVSRPISVWAKMGVTASNGKKLPASNILASLVLPDGQEGGSAFLVYNNFNVIMTWNRSTYFATSVGMIADRLGD
jgi:membrane-bound lytic murein transglycosylase B